MEKSINEEIVDYLKEHDMYYVEEFDEEGFSIDDEANDFVGDLTNVELCDMFIESMEDIAEVQRKRDIEKAYEWLRKNAGKYPNEFYDTCFNEKMFEDFKEAMSNED